jgi:hypothetical protein
VPRGRGPQSESEQRVLSDAPSAPGTGSDGLSDHIEINDVAGIKVVVEPAEEERLLGVLQDLGCRLTERELHMG